MPLASVIYNFREVNPALELTFDDFQRSYAGKSTPESFPRGVFFPPECIHWPPLITAAVLYRGIISARLSRDTQSINGVLR